jgi:hypothetical protein
MQPAQASAQVLLTRSAKPALPDRPAAGKLPQVSEPEIQMTRALLLSLSLASVLPAMSALAQTPDFGDDSSPWANDGECDDPRFEGAGMTQTPLLESDAMADATDCQQAFAAGTITLIGGGGAVTPGKGPTAPANLVDAGGIAFGDDSSEWARDGECDDRRFAGTAMANGLSWENTGRDATDCQAALNAGTVRLWVQADAMAATQCGSLNFGDDSSEFANDGECDDMRFEGLGSASIINNTHELSDATDCQRMCAFGAVALRDY